MIAGVAFDLYAGLFTPSKVADLSGVKRPVIDTMGTRDFIGPTRRERATERPLFSFRDVVKVRIMRSLAPLGMGLKEFVPHDGRIQKKEDDKVRSRHGRDGRVGGCRRHSRLRGRVDVGDGSKH